MSRYIHDHRVNGLNEALEIIAVDQPGPGGANHLYNIYVPDSVLLKPGVTISEHVRFQNGPIGSLDDINGISNEALLAIVIDRMRGFQYGRDANGEFNKLRPGKYACEENAHALANLEQALMWLQKRTRDRMARGVEGTHKV